MLQATGYPAGGVTVEGGGGRAAPIGKNEFKLRLFMLLTFKLIISTIFMYRLNWRSILNIFFGPAIVHKIRE